ncbi:MAG: molybdopterin-guanine dinucleotide biosynthesis protein B [Candidatus Bathyarchaeia archaeon]|nr:molybdopterin-guanine dinucleotide biosynthesis protein B [Candidatus Bathyarchaeota archaeon]
MNNKIKTKIAVVGYKNSGKTTIIEALVKALVNKGFKVATVKHISEKNFSIDKEGTDTWRHSSAGAKFVVAVAEHEVTIIMKNGFKEFLVKKLIEPLNNFDVLIFEGFKNFLNNEEVGKIICVRNEEEIKSFNEKTKGKIIAFCSFNLIKNVLKLPENLPELIELTLNFIEFEKEISELITKLPMLNCKKCGYPSCRELALQIYKGEASIADCKVLRENVKTKLIVDKREIPIQRFVSEIIRLTILGMISALKGVSVKGDEKVFIEVIKGEN